jgi:hypothetical protein
MANTVIQLKYSSTPGNIPPSLSNGEIALNYADGKFFYKNATGQIVSFAGSGNVYSFSTINANNSLITALSNSSILTIKPGVGVGITSDIINDIITIDSYASYNLAQAAFGYANTLSGGSAVTAYNQANQAYAVANTKTFTFMQGTPPSTANANDLWANNITGVVYENWGTTSTPIWAEFGPSTPQSSVPAGNVGFANLTLSGPLTTTNQYYSTYTGANGGATFMLSGNNTVGGAGYFDILKANNITAGSSGVTLRLDSSGSLQVVNGTYTSTLWTLTQSGAQIVNGASSTNNDATTNFISFNNQNSVIYDDGNFHIHSRTSGQSMWINTNGGDLRLLSQSPVNGGANGTSIIMGGSASSTASGYVNIFGSKIMNYSGYGYLSSGGAGTIGGSSGNVGVGLYCPNRIYSGEVDSTSDERLKDIKGTIPLDQALQFVKGIDGIHYTWKEGFGDDGIKAGFGAQSVHKAGFAHMVSGIPNEKVEGKTDDDGWVHPDKEQLNINYSEAIPYHHQVIKDLLNRIEYLERKVEELTNGN